MEGMILSPLMHPSSGVAVLNGSLSFRARGQFARRDSKTVVRFFKL